MHGFQLSMAPTRWQGHGYIIGMIIKMYVQVVFRLPMLTYSTQVMAWEGLVRVDGTTYRWLGNSGHGNATSLLTSEVTPTRSKFTISAGAVQLHLTFLSPIEVSSLYVDELPCLTVNQPDDWVLQSLPFVYLAIDVTSTDGQPHNVQLYSDVSGGEIPSSLF